MPGDEADSILLEPTERAARLPEVDPVAGVEVRRITVPAHADPDGPRVGYTIECPLCGQWTVLGLEGKVKMRPDGLTMEEPWTCSSSACSVVAGIRDGKIDAYDPEEQDVA